MSEGSVNAIQLVASKEGSRLVDAQLLTNLTKCWILNVGRSLPRNAHGNPLLKYGIDPTLRSDEIADKLWSGAFAITRFIHKH